MNWNTAAGTGDASQTGNSASKYSRIPGISKKAKFKIDLKVKAYDL